MDESFYAAQPGVCRVQVLGSKKSLEKEEKEVLETKSLEDNQWIPASFVWQSERWPSPGCPPVAQWLAGQF